MNNYIHYKILTNASSTLVPSLALVSIKATLFFYAYAIAQSVATYLICF